MSEDTLVILIEGEEGEDPVCVPCSLFLVEHDASDGTRKVELRMSAKQAAILRRQLKAGQ